jgi:DNA primase
LLSRVDIVDVIGRHVQLKKGGANLMGLCPFHGEKSPSFSVSPAKQFYYCFGCGASGDAIRFLTEHTGASFRDAVGDLAQQVGLQVPDDTRSDEQRQSAAQAKSRQTSLTDILARAADHYRLQLKSAPRAIDYLKGRGLTGEIAARFGIGYAP